MFYDLWETTKSSPSPFHFSNVNFEVTLVVQKTKHLVLEGNLET